MTNHDPFANYFAPAPIEWHVEIVTPDGANLKLTATLVELITTDGQIGVMPGHERLLTVLNVGELVIHNGLKRNVYLVSGGFARIQPERLSVLAFSLEYDTDKVALGKCCALRREFLGDVETDAISGPANSQAPMPKSGMDSPRTVWQMLNFLQIVIL